MKLKTLVSLIGGVGTTLALASPARSAAIVHYSLNEGSGTAFDSIGHVDMVPRTMTAAEFGLEYGKPSVPAGSYGSITITPTQSAAFGTAIYGAGVPENAMFINSTPNNVLNTLEGSRSITAWINPETITGVGRLLSSNRLDIGTARTGWGYGVRETGLQRFTTYGRKDFDQIAGTAVTFGEWQHVAMTFDQTSSTTATVRLYRNGNLVDTITGAPSDAANPNAIFGLFGTGAGGEPFGGTMDDVWVFNNVLSESEIRLVATGATLPEPGSAALCLAAGVLVLGRRRRAATAMAGR